MRFTWDNITLKFFETVSEPNLKHTWRAFRIWTKLNSFHETKVWSFVRFFRIDSVTMIWRGTVGRMTSVVSLCVCVCVLFLPWHRWRKSFGSLSLFLVLTSFHRRRVDEQDSNRADDGHCCWITQQLNSGQFRVIPVRQQESIPPYFLPPPLLLLLYLFIYFSTSVPYRRRRQPVGRSRRDRGGSTSITIFYTTVGLFGFSPFSAANCVNAEASPPAPN